MPITTLGATHELGITTCPSLVTKPGNVGGWQKTLDNNQHASMQWRHSVTSQPALSKCSSHTFQEKHDLYLCPNGVEKNNLQVLAMKLFSSPRLDTGALKLRLCPPKRVDGSVWQPGGQSCQLIIIFSTPETEQKIHLTPIPFPAPNSFRDPKKLPHQMFIWPG